MSHPCQNCNPVLTEKATKLDFDTEAWDGGGGDAVWRDVTDALQIQN
jgi:hypothetical protein